VNGDPVTDYSSEGIITLMARLSDDGLNNETVQTVLDEVKKNLLPNASFTSPSSLQLI
jgi:hypothetical protein